MKKHLSFWLAALALSTTQAQICASDGNAAPTVLRERFISADCASCWSQPGLSGNAGPDADTASNWVLDWIVPSAQGDEAPLAAAALRDAQQRLAQLRQPAPASQAQYAAPLALDAGKTLRVAYGLPYVNYVGTSLALQPADTGPWLAVLLLVEDLPAGTEGSPVARHLVRNMLVLDWNDAARSVDPKRQAWYEARPMSLPEGTRYERLRAVGWVQNTQGVIVALTRTGC